MARAAADNLARTTLELGGMSAQVVFNDARLDAVRDDESSRTPSTQPLD